MAPNLSCIQAQHLLEQAFIPTQHIPLALYAPENTPLLEESLCRQLHGNFFRITRPEELQTLNCAAVVVAAEDVQLMSTALMQYANAVTQGHDFAGADTAFPEETVLLNAASGVGSVAVMTKALFLRAAGDGVSPGEILRRAGVLAQSRTHLPWTLVRSFRPLKEDDISSPGRKRALLLSHSFSMTGAPLVLVSMVPVLKESGYDVTVVGPVWGNAAPLFAAAGAAVLVCKKQLDDPAVYQLARSSDLVLANTAEETDAVQKLSRSSVPVIWWLHDAACIYPPVEKSLPRTLGSNVRIFSVGEIARSAMHAYRPDFPIGQLLYGLPDLAREPRANRDFAKEGRLLFVNVGTVEPRKGQDILVRAIRMLTPAQLKKAHFLFVGKPATPPTVCQIEDLIRQYPESVSHIPSLTRDEIKALMYRCDCLVCPSRDDPMPTFVTEGAMFGKPAIVSEHTGTASLIRQGENGFVYRRNSAAALSLLLKKIIRSPEILAEMAPACRALYETRFTQEVFRSAVRDILNSL